MYENLPIYKKSFDLLVYIEDVVRNFSRYHKYSVGEILREDCRMLVKNIVKASKSDIQLRIEFLENVMEILDELKIYINVSKELKAFNNYNSYHHSIKLVDDVMRQCAGWMKKAKEISQPVL